MRRGTRSAGTGRRAGVAAGLLSVVALPAAAQAVTTRPERDPCRMGAPRADGLASVGERGELVLASGTRAVLSGLRWPDESGMSGQAVSWLAAHRDRPLRLTARGGEDRWGRSRADILAEGDEPVDLAGGLIARGLAHADSGEADVLCRPGLLALEEEPRARRHGVWGEPVREARDGDGLAASAGRFVVAQGRIVSVGERPGRTYLDFGRRDERALSVTVTKRTWRTLLERGLSAATLKGRLVRVRGTVEVWRGPILDIVSADMIEMLEEERAPRR